MYVRLNVATKPLVSHRRFYVGSALCGVVAGVLFVYLGWQLHDVRKAETDYRAKTVKLQAEMSRLMEQKHGLEKFYAKPENRDLQERLKFIDTVVEADSFNWTKMFIDLEQTLPPGVRVLKVDPKLEHGTVSVKFIAGASNQEAQAQLVKAFEDSKSFSHFELYSVGVPKQAGMDALLLEFSVIYTGI
jgi:Tfp pilus assembly protein PilN